MGLAQLKKPPQGQIYVRHQSHDRRRVTNARRHIGKNHFATIGLRQGDQFLQTDPIGSKDDLDLYDYVADDPVNKSDPTGLDGIIVPSLKTVGYGLAALGVEVIGGGPEDPVGDAGAAYFARRAAISYAGDVATATILNNLKPEDLKNKTRQELRDKAQEKGYKPDPKNDPNDPNGKEKFRDPNTNKQRIRIDPGHKDPKTGKPYDNPNAAQEHAHGYDSEGNPIRDPNTGDKHFPTRQN